MSRDTKRIVGIGVAIIMTIVGTGAVLAGLPLAQTGDANARLDGLDGRLHAVEIGFGRSSSAS